MGDVDTLARSIGEVGLLHPVVVTRKGDLIAGARRIEACRRLGWQNIPVTLVDLKDIVRGEFAENAIRKDFLPSEIDAIRRSLASKVAVLRGRPPGENEETFLISREPQTRDKIGAFAGVSERTVEKIAAIGFRCLPARGRRRGAYDILEARAAAARARPFKARGR
jgi:hypothetical protein